MKKTLLSIAFISISIASISAQVQPPKEVTTADYEQATKFLGFNTRELVYHENVRPTWIEDGKFWYSVNTKDGDLYVLVDPKTGKKKSDKSLKSLLDKNSEKEASKNSTSFNEVVSPDGKKAAFIRDWNLWVKDLDSNKETQLTQRRSGKFWICYR